ncbi:MAG: sialidase [Gemmatimonadetes bacterium]|nr:sialidase [Gemmatimonadota bacterium]
MRTFSKAAPSLAVLCLAPLASVAAQETRSGLFDELRYRFIGPAGNRVIAVAGEPGNPDVYYVGAASGGVWRTTDGGAAWEPVFDDQPASSIGALAVAPSDPNVIWAGTGETFIRANISLGNGIYRSTDGGDSWTHLGLDATGRIGRVVVHPEDPGVVYACALGHTYGPQEERGVFRTEDDGATWERVLFVDVETGCADLVIDPTNPRILFAGMWQIDVKTWGRTSGGPGSGIWVSRDAGDTWERLEGKGLPEPPVGKIGLGMSPADPDRVYALIETSSNAEFAPSDPYQGTLWRSDDGGRAWRMVNASHDLHARPLYYTRLSVSPTDADEVYFHATGHFTSLDGGETHFRTSPSPGYDHHDMWIDPEDPDRMISGHDGGISISTNRGRSWFRPQLPIAQVYHAHVDDRIPYNVYGNRQDGPSVVVPSNTRTGGEIPIGAWRDVGGCEVGFAVPDTVDDRTVWTGCYDGLLDVHDLETGLSRDVTVWPVAIESWAASDLEYRWQWTFPIEISPHDHNTVYVGSQHVHRTTNRGQSWEVISPDLTSDDPELQRRTGGLTFDDAGPTVAPAVFALAESPRSASEIWVGTNDGYVQSTRDGGVTWTDLTPNLPELPPRGTISSIQPSRHVDGKAYVAVDRHQVGDFEPYLYVTEDYGASWRRIDAGIPRSVFAFTHVLREDPVVPGLLYAGTENGIWVSFDDGSSWTSLQSNLPRAPVHWIAIQEHFHDLVVATYGRGFWILDDITPIRELARAGGPSGLEDVALQAPRPAYRFRVRSTPMSQPGDPVAGENPDYGALVHYFLPTDVDDETTMALDILDATGDVVSPLPIDRSAGLHRVDWGLRTEPTTQARLRHPPTENPHLPFPERGWRPMPDGGRLTVLVPPGTYTVRLIAGPDTLTRTLEVRKDPESLGSEADIARQMIAVDRLRGMLDDAATLINEAEETRAQLGGLLDRLDDEIDDHEAIAATIERISEEIMEIEGELFDLRHTGTGQDGLRWPRLLYARIASLARGIMSSDARPTDQQLAVLEILAEQWHTLDARYRTTVSPAVDDLNAQLRAAGVPLVTTTRRRPAS